MKILSVPLGSIAPAARGRIIVIGPACRGRSFEPLRNARDHEGHRVCPCRSDLVRSSLKIDETPSEMVQRNGSVPHLVADHEKMSTPGGRVEQVLQEIQNPLFRRVPCGRVLSIGGGVRQKKPGEPEGKTIQQKNAPDAPDFSGISSVLLPGSAMSRAVRPGAGRCGPPSPRL